MYVLFQFRTRPVLVKELRMCTFLQPPLLLSLFYFLSISTSLNKKRLVQNFPHIMYLLDKCVMYLLDKRVVLQVKNIGCSYYCYHSLNFLLAMET